MRKYVLTGGPCSGKTTTIEALAARGHAHLPELARALIEESQRTGSDLVPWIRAKDFQEELMRRQHAMEDSIAPASLDGHIVLDRGIADSVAYCRVLGVPIQQRYVDAARNARYRGVFLLSPLPYRKDNVRFEDEATARKIHDEIKHAYAEAGYAVINVPAVPVVERVAFIERVIQEHAITARTDQ
jgi:predicted ATPase